MATAHAPLFSLDAHGKIGQALIFTGSTQGHAIRHFHKPSGDPTAAQVTQRTRVHNAVDRWHGLHSATGFADSFNLFARISDPHWTAYSAFQFAAIKAQAQTAGPSFASSAVKAWDMKATVNLVSLADGLAPSEAGNLDVLAGAEEDNLQAVGTIAANSATVTTPALGAAGATVFFQLSKAGFARSGIYQMTLAGPPANLVVNGDFAADATWAKQAGWSIPIGYGRYLSTGIPPRTLTQNVAALVAGRTYRTTFTLTFRPAAGAMQLTLGGTLATSRSAVATYVEDVVCGATLVMGFRAIAAAGNEMRIDNVYVQDFSAPPP